MDAYAKNLRPSRRGQMPAPQDEGFFPNPPYLHAEQTSSGNLFLHPEEARSAVSKDEGTPSIPAQRLAFRNGAFASGERVLAEETAIAISYNGSTHAVLMATPQDLVDFAIGFSLTERIISERQAIETIEIVQTGLGADVQVRLTGDVAAKLAARRRSMAGPAGCGLCGIESLEGAMRAIQAVNAQAGFSPTDIADAATQLSTNQPLNAQTRATHAAGFYVPGQGLVASREDVGRHNALDKLIGALSHAGIDAATGAIVMTSRVSVEMVQKTAIAGAGMIIAVSAPTALAVHLADEAGITLAAIVRGAEFDVFTHPQRIGTGASAHVA